jgi:lipopolysaccharide assembly LptE-like protein
VKATFAAGLACLSLTGCLGYHIGPVKPYYMRDVHAIAVPTFKNKTLLPRVEALVTDTVIKQLQQDGTYKIASDSDADAVLKGEITRVDRLPARSVRGNVLATQEFNLRMEVRYTVAARDGTALTGGRAAGATSFFVSADPTTDERQALPLATEELASQLVTQLSEGW